MAPQVPPHSAPAMPSPPVADGMAVRVIALPHAPWRVWVKAAALSLVTAAPLTILLLPGRPADPHSGNAAVSATSVRMTNAEPASPPVAPAATTAPPPALRPVPAAEAVPVRDPNDLASYVRPGDPEPTMAEVISALRETGEQQGIAAFNPPGTSPPLKGLAVPPDYVLPPGYVRHHQVTDQGEPIEPILMYAPDHVLLDAAGQTVPIPEDRIVPPERAPPGLPIRQVEIPSP